MARSACYRKLNIGNVVLRFDSVLIHVCFYLQVVGAKVVTNARSPGARCYGFVTMCSTEEATTCISHLHRTELHGRMISVERVCGFVYYLGANILEFARDNCEFSPMTISAFGHLIYCIPILFSLPKVDFLQKVLSSVQVPLFLNSFASELGGWQQY